MDKRKEIEYILRKPFKTRKEINECIEEIKVINARLTSIPSSSNIKEKVQTSVINTDLTKHIDRKNELEAKIVKLTFELENEQETILNLISKIEDSTDKLIIRCRYLLFYSWDEIAFIVGLSTRQVLRRNKIIVMSLSVATE